MSGRYIDYIRRKRVNCDQCGQHVPTAISGRRPNMQTKNDKKGERKRERERERERKREREREREIERERF